MTKLMTAMANKVTTRYDGWSHRFAFNPTKANDAAFVALNAGAVMTGAIAIMIVTVGQSLEAAVIGSFFGLMALALMATGFSFVFAQRKPDHEITTTFDQSELTLQRLFATTPR